MKLAVVRGANPNVAEAFTFSKLTRWGIEPTFIGEFPHNLDRALERTVGVPICGYAGLDAVLRPIPSRVRPLARFVLEQKLGMIAPLLRARVLDEFDAFSVSDLTPYHALQIARLAKAGRRPLVVTLWENVPGRERRGLLGSRISATVATAATRFVAVTEYAAATARLAGLPSERIAVIPPAVDHDRFRPGLKSARLLDQWGIGEDAFVLLFNGRLQRTKGLDALLSAMALLDRDDPALARRLILLVVGTGREAVGYRRLAERLGLAARIRFVGRLPFTRLPEVYAAADVFVLPSSVSRWWQEQMGFALLEAMSCGVPVVSTHSGAIPEVVGDAALLASPGNFYEIAAAIRRLAGDEPLRRRLGTRGRELVLARHDAEMIGQRLSRIFLGDEL